MSGFQKVLLTATPLQNSLLELYGLVSIVDEHVFGDLRSFKAQFSKMNSTASAEDVKTALNAFHRDPSKLNDFQKVARRAEKAQSETYASLKQRLRPVCQRTLRRQVLAYVSYTNRHAMVQEFFPTAQNSSFTN